MEGFLQSLKFADVVEQADICLLSGAEAQSRGRGQDWSSGILWWRGKSYDRLSDDYQGRLDRAFDALRHGKVDSVLAAAENTATGAFA